MLSRVRAKENFDIKEWHLTSASGTLINDETKFIENTTIFAVSKRKTASYKVKHLKENIENEEYTEVVADEQTKMGKVGKETEAVAKQYEGFTAEVFSQSLIEANGSTVIKIKYKRNRVSLILELQGGKTTTALDDGENGKKLLKGKFEARVEVKDLKKENHGFEKWEPALPEKFPATNPTIVYVAKWKRINYKIRIAGDERVKVAEPQYIDIPISTPKSFGDIKSEIKAKVSLAEGWYTKYYCFYDWRIGGEKGDEMLDSTEIIEDITVYARTNYKSFKVEGTELKGYEEEKPRGRIFLPKEITKIGRYAFSGCGTLTSVNLSGCSEITEIGENAFIVCIHLESIDLSSCSKLITIGGNAFCGCSTLSSIDLSKCSKLTKIYYGAFLSCREATVKLPVSITEIEDEVFGVGEGSYCKKVLVPNEKIKELVRDTGYPEDRIEMY